MKGPLEIWKALGGSGDAPALLGRWSGPLLVLGGGRTAWQDLARAEASSGTIMAINDIGAHYHGIIAHWVSLHPEYFPGWRIYRVGHCFGQGQPFRCHSHHGGEGVDVVWPIGNIGGCSGLFACYVGLMLGHAPIVLAGVPMTNDGHYFDPPHYTTDFTDRAQTLEWAFARDEIFAGRVKSLSGRTRDWLGEP